MKIVITTKQYRSLVFSLLKTLVGKLSMETDEDNTMHVIFDFHGEEIMSIYFKGMIRNVGCKKDLTLYNDFARQLEGYIPYYKHKIFSEVLVDYVYQELGIKCDCIEYEHDFINRYRVDDNEEYHWIDSRTRKYNVKKKKKIK